MKFEKRTDLKGAFIPRSALSLSGFEPGQEAQLHTPPGAVVLLKKRMTAMEVLTAVESLSTIASDLLTELLNSCGPCDECQDEGCPYADAGGESISLPSYLREEAGIAPDAKLCAEVNEGEKTVMIYATDHKHDLSDVPDGLLPLLECLGVCLGELEEKLITGEVVYHG